MSADVSGTSKASEENGCVRCGKRQNRDGSAVQWICQGCGGRVCYDCTLTVPGSKPVRYYDETLCSTACWEKVGSPTD